MYMTISYSMNTMMFILRIIHHCCRIYTVPQIFKHLNHRLMWDYRIKRVGEWIDNERKTQPPHHIDCGVKWIQTVELH